MVPKLPVPGMAPGARKESLSGSGGGGGSGSSGGGGGGGKNGAAPADSLKERRLSSRPERKASTATTGTGRAVATLDRQLAASGSGASFQAHGTTN